MAESQWAKDMRREAQRQTNLADAAYDQSVQSRAYAEEGSRHSEDAAIAASNAEYYAAEQLEAQLDQNEVVRTHQFAMWRQETLNGHAYESWRDKAEPLYTEFNRRWSAWKKVQTQDIAAVRAKREAQAKDHFRLDSQWHMFAERVAPESSSWFEVARVAFPICLGMTAFGYLMAAAMPKGFGEVWALSMLGVFLTITIGMIIMSHMAIAHRNRQQKAREWVSAEKEAFVGSFPEVWGDSRGWRDTYAVHKAVESMPTAYLNFKEAMLVEIPSRQPEAVPPEALPDEAVHTRSLLASWA